MKLVKFVALIIVLIIINNINVVKADNLSSYCANLNIDEWTLLTDQLGNLHRGTNTQSFKYYDGWTEYYYDECVLLANDLWDGYINVAEDNNSQSIIYSYSNQYSGEFGYVSYGYDQSTTHMTPNWNMYLNDWVMSYNPYEVQLSAVSHEFGHVFGLNHINDNMYPNTCMGGCSYPTDQEIWGIRVATGNHQIHLLGDYISNGSIGHYKRCVYCSIPKQRENHVYNGNNICIYCGWNNN